MTHIGFFSRSFLLVAVLSAGILGAVAICTWAGYRIAPVQASQPSNNTSAQSGAGLSGDVVSSVPYPNCRFGVGGSVNGFDVAALNVGWHLDFATRFSPSRPNGAEYVQIVRLAPTSNGFTFDPITDTLYAIIANNPGSIWLIGNEPDSIWQDKLLPETYARAYHHLYHLIKQRDSTAQVGIGGLVQPTPLRFQYLDRIWQAYLHYYGERLPTDLWNVHSYILREIDASDPEAYPNGPYSVWGAYIPPGIAATRGIIYNESDMFSLSIFQQRLLDLRRWMADHGERDKPLYITEYGELFPYPPYMPGNDPDPYVDENGVPITEARVAAFMTSTFNWLQSASDPAFGYPADGNRLVQRWLWFSTNYPGYGGMLFNPNTAQRTQLGEAFYSYTRAISPEIDLMAVRLTAEPAALCDIGVPQTTTLKVLISNAGNISVSMPFTVSFYAGQPGAGALIASHIVTPTLNGCAATIEVTQTWSGLSSGANYAYVRVESDNQIGEIDKDNNLATGVVLVTNQRVYLPIGFRSYVSQP